MYLIKKSTLSKLQKSYTEKLKIASFKVKTRTGS